ncbi:predicted protein [Naegleria gruberi]|uniref:Predicted protein n=1 Tax=Naegleria gruberi TaxID=5762 RepID=D2VAA3_NAEGR|nr:uncharacterized protein NAEGRDRAFT_65789 [Naegleria gruberi]EFC46395.1 predicted protein [Naegleria gruberi]|eukprot:XP_002679139.1 predicted protein [Naegleria gruberi strain NEG-M]
MSQSAKSMSVPPSPPPKMLKQLQRWSGITFSVFVTLHVATTISAALSPLKYDSVLETTRGIYRPNMIVEGLVVFAPLAVHMFVNSLLSFTQKKAAEVEAATASLSKKLHSITGYILSFLIPMHIFGNRFKNSFNASFASIAFVAEKEMGMVGALGFFGFLLACGLYHTIYGLNIALGYKLKKPLVMALIIAALSASYYGILGFVGLLYPDQMVAVRAQYDQFAN